MPVDNAIIRNPNEVLKSERVSDLLKHMKINSSKSNTGSKNEIALPSLFVISEVCILLTAKYVISSITKAIAQIMASFMMRFATEDVTIDL